MTTTTKTTVKKLTLVTVAVVLASGLAATAFAGDGARGGKLRRFLHARHEIQQEMRRRRGKALAFLQSLQFTDDQRRVMLDKARAAAPIVEGAKTEARKLVAGAWAQAGDGKVDKKALREQVKTQIKALREKSWTQIEPLAKDVVATLTPEQRQKFEAAAAKRGKTVDDAKLAKFMGHLITRPMAVPYLEARLAQSPR